VSLTGIVVSYPDPRQGPPQAFSIGWVTLTTIGATYFADCSPPVRAVPDAPTSTEFSPKTLAKKPGAGFSTRTRIVSNGSSFVSNSTLTAARPVVFLLA
jgi:hypothetical protein